MKIEWQMPTVLKSFSCLNPCSNGMKIEFSLPMVMVGGHRCLNPCCNGMKIEYPSIVEAIKSEMVLILVVME